MKKHEETRPFNLEHARAGAPIACRGGMPASILKWNSRALVGGAVLGCCGEYDIAHNWSLDGSHPNTTALDLVMIPLGYIDGKPVFVGDEIELKVFGYVNQWKRVKAEPSLGRTLGDDGTCARWPAPAKQYPVTRIDDVSLVILYEKTLNQPGPDGGRHSAVKAVANATLRHAVDAGQVVPPFPGALHHDNRTLYGTVADVDHFGDLLRQLDPHAPTKQDYDRISRDLGKAERLLESLGYRSAGAGEWTAPAGRHFYGQVNGIHVEGDANSINVVQDLAERGAARDMAVAEAVRDASYVAVMNCETGHEGTVVRQVDLTKIIAKVQQ